MPKEKGQKVVAQNRKARHDFHIEDTWEAGLVLVGTEVKSLRAGRASLAGRVRRGRRPRGVAARACTSRSTPRAPGPTTPPRRKRKLLLNRAEIAKIERKITDKGYTLVPLQLYFKDGRAKVEIGLARGKKAYDKRHALAERQADREQEQAVQRRLKGHQD